MLSVCMIVRDEEQNLKRCLESIKEYGFEIIIVDTGSQDRTREIALEYTEKVFDFAWVNDFSKARNFSISKASNDYILILDADERVETIDINQLKNVVKNSIKEIGQVIIESTYTRENDVYTSREKVSRFFNKKYYNFEGSIHEQLVPMNKVFFLNVLLSHTGYLKEEIKRKNKSSRNIKMLREELERNSDDPYILYQMGKSLFSNNDYGEARIYFERAMDFELDTKQDFVKDLVETYGYTLINLEDFSEGLKLLNIYESFKGTSDFHYLIGLIYMNNGYISEAINEFELAKTYVHSKVKGVNDYLANYNIALIFECVGDVKNAVKYYRLCGEYSKAVNRLNNIQ